MFRSASPALCCWSTWIRLLANRQLIPQEIFEHNASRPSFSSVYISAQSCNLLNSCSLFGNVNMNCLNICVKLYLPITYNSLNKKSTWKYLQATQSTHNYRFECKVRMVGAEMYESSINVFSDQINWTESTGKIGASLLINKIWYRKTVIFVEKFIYFETCERNICGIDYIKTSKYHAEFVFDRKLHQTHIWNLVNAQQYGIQHHVPFITLISNFWSIMTQFFHHFNCFLLKH